MAVGGLPLLPPSIAVWCAPFTCNSKQPDIQHGSSSEEHTHIDRPADLTVLTVSAGDGERLQSERRVFALVKEMCSYALSSRILNVSGRISPPPAAPKEIAVQTVARVFRSDCDQSIRPLYPFSRQWPIFSQRM